MAAYKIHFKASVEKDLATIPKVKKSIGEANKRLHRITDGRGFR